MYALVPGSRAYNCIPKQSKGWVFITDTLVANDLCGAASAVLNINKSDNDLNLWSTHSIRVTAANLLHMEKFADSFIMKCLCWSSYDYMDYPRGTIYAAEQHAGLEISNSNIQSLVECDYCHDNPHRAVMASAVAQLLIDKVFELYYANTHRGIQI